MDAEHRADLALDNPLQPSLMMAFRRIRDYRVWVIRVFRDQKSRRTDART